MFSRNNNIQVYSVSFLHLSKSLNALKKNTEEMKEKLISSSLYPFQCQHSQLWDEKLVEKPTTIY